MTYINYQEQTRKCFNNTGKILVVRYLEHKKDNWLI